MNPVQFGGFFTFRYPGERKLDIEKFHKENNQSTYRMGNGQVYRLHDEYAMDAYEETEAEQAYTVLTLSTPDHLDRNQKVIHQLLLKVADMFGADAKKDVRDGLKKFVAREEEFPVFFGPKTPDTPTTPEKA